MDCTKHVTLEFGIPYRDMLPDKVLCIPIREDWSIADLMGAFLADNHAFVEQSAERGYFDGQKLKAVYTLNGRLVSVEERITDGDSIRVIVPIVGG
jgi:sulfur carrier protein ThiS